MCAAPSFYDQTRFSSSSLKRREKGRKEGSAVEQVEAATTFGPVPTLERGRRRR